MSCFFFPSKFLSLNSYLLQLHIFFYPVVDSDSLLLKVICVCRGEALCWGVCQGTYVEIGGHLWGAGSLLPPLVPRRRELSLRLAWQSTFTCHATPLP